jgi:1-phosphofructokinase family hexose kinase
MILCVNPNAALDKVLIGERLTPGATMRIEKVLDCIGGKSADAALVLKTLGAEHMLVSFMAGETGRYLESIFNSRGIQNHLVWVAGETRTAYVITERVNHRHTHVTTRGYNVTPADVDIFMEQVCHFAVQASWVIMAGSLPAGSKEIFYASVTEAAHNSGAKVLLDTFGAGLMAALPARPEVVKMNRIEFSETFAVTADSLDQLVFEVRENLLKPYALSDVVITMEEDGILAVSETEAWLACPPKLTPINAAGAGDAASATIAYRLSLGDPWLTALQWAGAVSAAVVLTEGTAEFDYTQAKLLFPRVQVKRLS